jgi:hypothetical protein
MITLAVFSVRRNQQQTSDTGMIPKSGYRFRARSCLDKSVAATTVDRARVDRFNSANKQEETAAA